MQIGKKKWRWKDNYVPNTETNFPITVNDIEIVIHKLCFNMAAGIENINIYKLSDDDVEK